jgi:mannitol/fructose-specific phosphotransferase system IIA component
MSTAQSFQEYQDVAVLIAVALAQTRSLNLLDRLTYGLNSESVRMAVADALRVV